MASKTKTGASKVLDRVEGDVVKQLAGYKCQRGAFNHYEKCGEGVQWCHVIQRARKALRWERSNSLCLCGPCHYWFDNVATDRQRYMFVESIRPGTYDHLEAADVNNTPRNEALFDLSLTEMNELILSRRAELKSLKELKNGRS